MEPLWMGRSGPILVRSEDDISLWVREGARSRAPGRRRRPKWRVAGPGPGRGTFRADAPGQPVRGTCPARQRSKLPRGHATSAHRPVAVPRLTEIFVAFLRRRIVRRWARIVSASARANCPEHPVGRNRLKVIAIDRRHLHHGQRLGPLGQVAGQGAQHSLETFIGKVSIEHFGVGAFHPAEGVRMRQRITQHLFWIGRHRCAAWLFDVGIHFLVDVPHFAEGFPQVLVFARKELV